MTLVWNISKNSQMCVFSGTLPDRDNFIFLRYFLMTLSPYQDLVKIYSVSAETIINDAFSYSENV
jgi:hypothetical protein